MQEHDWDSFVDTLVSDDTRDAHAQSVQSPLSVVCEMPPAYYCQPLIALPPLAALGQNVQPAYYNQQPLPYHPPLPPPAPPPTPPAPPPTQPAPPPTQPAPHRLCRRRHYTVTEWRLSKKKPEPRLRQQHRERPSDATKRNWIVLGESSSSVATEQNAALSTKVTMYVQERLPMSSNEW